MKKLLLILLLLLFPQLIASQEVRTALVKDSGKQVYRCDLGANADEVSIDLETSPKVSFSKWNKENSLSIKIPAGLINYTAPTIKDSKTIEIKDSKTGFYFNRFDDENFKFGLILSEIPDQKQVVTINGEEYYEWEFDIEGLEDFNVYYQPPLANVNPDGSTWEDNGHGGSSERPANISGSWAIYHKTKRDYIIGQTNYGIGKFGHFLKPKFIDTNGDWIWGILRIINSKYKVAVLKKWVDKAVYPVKANDTWGNTGIGGTDDWGNNSTSFAMYTSSTPSSSGTLTSLTMALWNQSSGTNHAKLALYANSSGTPAGLIANAYTGSLTITTTTKPTSDLGTWTSGNTVGGTIVSGTTYCFSVNNDHANVSYAFDTTTGNLRNYDLLAYTSFPADPFGTVDGTWRAYLFSIYATHTPTAVNTLLTNCSLTKAGLRAQ